jgi:hypothetical protein
MRWILLVIVFLGLSGSAYAEDVYEITLFVSENSLILYADGTAPINLDGLGFEVVAADNQRIVYLLSEFASFSILRLDRVPTPICLRIELTGNNEPLPQSCQSPTRTLTHAVAQNDVFWWDRDLRQTRTILFIQQAEQIDFCPAGQVECQLRYTQVRSSSPSPTLSATQIAAVAPASRTDNNPLAGTVGFPVLSNDEWTPVMRVFGSYPMVFVPVGCFLMGDETGSLDERPVHQQCVDTPLWLDQYEVSNAQYGSTGRFTAPDLPRDSLTWFEARAFCERRSGRLPTAVEWEYAARGPSGWSYTWGNSFVEENANAFRVGVQSSEPVNSYPGGESWLGAFNMTGNVWEWTSSTYTRSYPYTAAQEDPDNTLLMRELRGGSWRYEPIRVRSAYRGAIPPTGVYDDVGVRCVRDAAPGDPN